jgi:hypothetical protein
MNPLWPRNRISQHIAFARLTRSDTARKRRIANRPRPTEIRNLRRVALALERVERYLGMRLDVTSGFRGPKLNAAVGGVPRSQHTRGQAVDVQCHRYGSAIQLARAIVRSGVRFDQLIYEFGCSADGGWIHVSIAPRPRRRILTICSSRRGYRIGLHPCFDCA